MKSMMKHSINRWFMAVPTGFSTVKTKCPSSRLYSINNGSFRIESTYSREVNHPPNFTKQLITVTRRASSSRSVAQQVASTSWTTAPRPYSEIPKKKSLIPAQLGLLLSGGPGYLHEHCDMRHKELGPIYREQLGSHELIFIANTKMIQTVIANEGTQPHHNVPEAWTLYNEVKQVKRGLFFQVGEPWLKLRRAFNKVMLADATKITRFTSELVAVNDDLLNNWIGRSKQLRECDKSFIIKDVKFELCKWSIEATGLMLFGQRMGCLQTGHSDGNDDKAANSKRAERLVRNVAQMFHETSKFQIIPARLAHKLNLRAWRKFVDASDTMIELASEYAKEFIAQAKCQSSSSSSSKSLLNDLLRLNALSDDEISHSLVDLIIAAADTTSNALQWALYMLAKHPEAQAKILEEILRGQEPPVLSRAPVWPYLSGFVREVSRLYPTAPFLARTLDHTISLDGYEIPAGKTIVFSLYTTSRMDEYFEAPLEFRPERWLRTSAASGRASGAAAAASSHDTSSSESRAASECQRKFTKPSHAYATLPFGIGSRMCIGRRMAELEMHQLIASIVSRFQVSLAEPRDEIKIKLKMILCPDKPINIRLTPR